MHANSTSYSILYKLLDKIKGKQEQSILMTRSYSFSIENGSSGNILQHKYTAYDIYVVRGPSQNQSQNHLSSFKRVVNVFRYKISLDRNGMGDWMDGN